MANFSPIWVQNSQVLISESALRTLQYDKDNR